MGTLLNRYHASEDHERFSRWQSRTDQRRALRTLDYADGGITGEFGRIIELRNAIEHEGERIPGRSHAESAEMVADAIDWYRTMAHAPSVDHSPRLRRIVLLSATVVMVVAVPLWLHFVPTIVHLFSGLVK